MVVNLYDVMIVVGGVVVIVEMVFVCDFEVV